MRIPVYDQQVTPQVAPAVAKRPISYQTPRSITDGSIYKATETMGNTLSGVANELLKIHVAEQAKADDLAVLDASNRWAEDITGFLNDPEKGIYTRMGKGAKGATGDTAKHLDEIEREISKGLENDRQRELFKRFVMRDRLSRIEGVSRHERSEFNKYRLQVADDSVNTAISSISASPYDEETFQAELDRAENAIISIIGDQGEEIVSEKVKSLHSAAHLARLAGILQDNPRAAEAYFKENKDKIDGQQHAKWKAAIEKEVSILFGQEESDRLYQKFGIDGEAKAVKWVRDHYEGDKESKLMTHLQARYVDERRFKAERESKAFDSLYDHVAEASSYAEALTIIEKSDVRVRHRRSLEAYAREIFEVSKGGSPITPPATSARLQTLMDKETLFDEYPTWKAFYAEFGADLSYGDRNRYHSMYESTEKPPVVFSLQKAIDKAIKDAKIDDLEEQSEFHDSVIAHIAYDEGIKGRKLTTTERTAVIQDLSEMKILRRRAWWIHEKIMGYKIPPGYEFNGEHNQWEYEDPNTGIVYDLNGTPIGRYTEE